MAVPTQKEYRRSLRERLQAAGLWDEYVAEREELAKARGIKRRGAGKLLSNKYEEQLTAKGFSGERATGTSDEGVDGVDGSEDFGQGLVPIDPVVAWTKQKASLRRDIEWVYQHIEVKVKPSDAPSPGAWSLLRWVRRQPGIHQGEFYRVFCPRLVQAAGEAGENDESDEGEAGVERACEELLAFGNAAQSPGAEGIEGESEVSAPSVEGDEGGPGTGEKR